MGGGGGSEREGGSEIRAIMCRGLDRDSSMNKNINSLKGNKDNVLTSVKQYYTL